MEYRSSGLRAEEAHEGQPPFAVGWRGSREAHFHSAYVERFFIPWRLRVQDCEQALDRPVYYRAGIVTSLCRDALATHNTRKFFAIHLTQRIAMRRTMYDA